jgi:methionyl-tRNA formyltransferase
MEKIKCIFFGSTSDSVLVLQRLINLSNVNLSICCVVTQPPRPIGRKQIVTPTPVEVLAKANNIPVLSFPSDPTKPSFYENEQVVIDTLAPFKADLIISASYGQKIPTATIASVPHGGLNVHPSILPRWRGADPVPWAIMSGDHQTGVTLVTLSEQFDEGKIVAQKKIPITNKDFADPLRAKLFTMGATLLTETLPTYIASKGEALKGSPSQDAAQKGAQYPYARRFTRDDGFEPWEKIQKAFEDPAEATRIDRKYRALTPWPGLWTEIEETRDKGQEARKKRLKILVCQLSPVTHLILETVQLEGKTSVSFHQFSNNYL